MLRSYTGAAAKVIAWTQLVVLKKPKLDPDFDGYPGGNIKGSDVDPATDENVGGYQANDPQIADFINAGRKLIMTHGLSDLIISSEASQAYYKNVVEQTTPALKGPYSQVSDGFRYYEIPGMAHCRDGPGPWHFGSPTQNDEWLRHSHVPPSMLTAGCPHMPATPRSSSTASTTSSSRSSLGASSTSLPSRSALRDCPSAGC